MQMMASKKKHLSSIANDVLHRCAESVDTSVDRLVQEFEVGWNFETPEDYSRKLVEFCSSKALKSNICCTLQEKIADGTFSRFTFDMMLAWEKPNAEDEKLSTNKERIAKEKEDKKMALSRAEPQINDDVSLFYSDLMPLLVDEESSIGEDAFVWLGSLLPLVVEVVNGRFTFETLTASTAQRLHFPAYDTFLKEINKCIKYLQKQTTPTGVELADDEYILHREGTAKTHRVVRHIGGTSWPGRLTLTNYALYFEASGVITYEDALKIDLSKKIDHTVRKTSTGPWGAPIYDKAITYESSQLSETVVLEFPEMTSSTRREHWLTLIREVILLHQFLSNLKDISPLQSWEMQARTILAILRLHAAREMLRISPPVPKTFLIFSMFDELPKGDYVLEELAHTLKQINSTHPCSASSILKSLNISGSQDLNINAKKEVKESPSVHPETITTQEATTNRVREEAMEIDGAMGTVEGLKEEGISDSLKILMELLSPLKSVAPSCQHILAWDRPVVTLLVFSAILISTYKEWIGKAIAALLVWAVREIYQARRDRIKDSYGEIVVCTGSDQSSMESIVSAQTGIVSAHHGVYSAQSIVQMANISILKIQSILLSRAPKHTNLVMMVMIGLAIFLAIVPLKFIIMTLTSYVFMMNAFKRGKNTEHGKNTQHGKTERRLQEWWNSIPAIPVRTVDKAP